MGQRITCPTCKGIGYLIPPKPRKEKEWTYDEFKHAMKGRRVNEFQTTSDGAYICFGAHRFLIRESDFERCFDLVKTAWMNREEM